MVQVVTMVNTQRFYPVTTDGLRLAGFAWRPKDPVAVVVFAHGLGEYSGTFYYLFEQFLAAGFAVVSVDHRGHGASSGTRHLLNRFDDLVDDYALAIDFAEKMLPELPIFAVGHSMGGLIVARYALRPSNRLQGAVISSAALSVVEPYPPAVSQGLLKLSHLIPRFPLLVAGPPSHPRNPWGVSGYLPLATAREIILTGARTRDQAGEMKIPVLFNHGDEDQLTPVEGVVFAHAAAGSIDKSIQIWPGLGHNLLHDASTGEVIGSVVSWLGHRSATSPAKIWT